MSAGAGPTVAIDRDVIEAMVAHCRREDPLECCGILGGRDGRAVLVFPLRNADSSPTRYTADPRDLIAAVQAMRESGDEIVAIYHSHPRWPAIPSKTDLRENYYGDVPRIIVSLLADPPEVRIWRLEPESFEELSWRVVESSSGCG